MALLRCDECDEPTDRQGGPSAAGLMFGLLVFLVLVVLLLSAFPTLGAEPVRVADQTRDHADRVRKVRVALALAGVPARPAVAVAPPPRPAGKLPYAEAYPKATLDQMPLVMYVGCDGPRIDGAVNARSEAFAGIDGPAVVVGYPIGDRMYFDAILAGAAATPEAVGKAVRSAARKMEGPPKAMPPAAPKPLNTQIRATPGCPCGDSCGCPGGVCPAGCPSAPQPVAFPAYRPFPVAGGCPNGRCPGSFATPVQGGAPFGATFPGAGCPGGNCPRGR